MGWLIWKQQPSFRHTGLSVFTALQSKVEDELSAKCTRLLCISSACPAAADGMLCSADLHFYSADLLQQRHSLLGCSALCCGINACL